MFQIKIQKKWNRQNCVVTVFMESSGPIFLTKGNDIPYLYVLTFGWKPYFSTILLVTHLSFIIKNGKRTFTSHEVWDLNPLNQNTEILIIIHF